MSIKLDFTAIEELRRESGKNQKNKVKKTFTPEQLFKESADLTETPSFQPKTAISSEPPKEAKKSLDEGYMRLQRRADRAKANIERASSICSEWHENRLKTERLQTEILQGLKLGESTASLFLKAIEALSLTIDNAAFLKQVEEDYLTVQGEGLNEPEALEQKLARTENNLNRLRRNFSDKETPLDVKERLREIIRVQEKETERLKKKIEKGTGQG